MDEICDYDEGYDREDAYEIGWCYECKCNYECPMKRKVLLKEGYLLNDTIYNNITLGQECDKNTFEQILRKVNLFHFVNELPEKENTIVGDNGALISGGQKKRIILARAILNKAPIVILDEPTTGLDEKNAKEVVRNLMDEFSKSLVVVISHQMDIIELCNTKYRLHDQKIEQV